MGLKGIMCKNVWVIFTEYHVICLYRCSYWYKNSASVPQACQNVPQIKVEESWRAGQGVGGSVYVYNTYICTSLYEFCYRSYIQRECHSALVKLHPITFYRIISGECAVPGLNATFCFLWFTNCVLLFDKSLILGCLWPLVCVLHNILILGIWCSTIPHLPGCFCPWTFFENTGFNTVLTDPFMSHLATQLGYSAREFQALQLIVLAAFGVVD